jgi:hypothetical protein
VKIWRKEVAETFCNFWKVTRVNLELFFKFQGSEYKNLDHELILMKYRGLFANW